MPQPTTYEIELRCQAHDRVLRPVVDEVAVEPTGSGTTRLVGEIRDPSHLHGLLSHFTSMNVEVVALRRLDHAPQPPQQRHPDNSQGGHQP
jgi:hypothetical protein